MAEITDSSLTLDKNEKLPYLTRDLYLPDDPERQRELLEGLRADGFTFRTNGGVKRDLGRAGLPVHLSLPTFYLENSTGSPSVKPRNYPGDVSNLIESFGVDNVTRVKDTRLVNPSGENADPYFVSTRGEYALFAREAKSKS